MASIWRVAGLALASSTFLERFITRLLDESFDLTLTSGNDVAWGFAFVALGLAYNLVAARWLLVAENTSGRGEGIRHRDHDPRRVGTLRYLCIDTVIV